MEKPSKGLVAAILRYVSGLRFPSLFALSLLVFGVDLLVPDVFPFLDELLFGLLTLLLGAWRKRKDARSGTEAGRRTGIALARPSARGDVPQAEASDVTPNAADGSDPADTRDAAH